jgi:cytochrome d ubiquinol oxidase subunit I
MDPVFLSRLQFGLTIGFHFLFPPISIGLAWLLVIMEWLGWRRKDETYVRASTFFAGLLGLTFIVGVASGIVMEFQFGTNWARYSKFVGDIFGAPLAAEAVFAFFLESSFLALYLFGRNRVSKGVHWLSSVMVAVGATISAFWIIVANSWQQTPAGFVLRNGRAELESFREAVFNPSTLVRFFHTMDAALIVGAFFVAGIAAYRLLANRVDAVARKSLNVAIVVGFIASIAALYPTGDDHAKQVARTQPAKFAAMEGLFETQTRAPALVFGIPSPDSPEVRARLEIPGLLSWMVHNDIDAEVTGLDRVPADERPPLFLTFVTFHSMVMLGMLFIATSALGVLLLLRRSIWTNRRYLRLLVFSAPLPVIVCQLGWMTAEVGRQPWIVYGLLRTSEAHSTNVGAGSILLSIILFSIIYLILGALYVFVLMRKVRHGIDEARLSQG